METPFASIRSYRVTHPLARTPLNLPYSLYFTNRSLFKRVESLLLTASPLFSPKANRYMGIIHFFAFLNYCANYSKENCCYLSDSLQTVKDGKTVCANSKGSIPINTKKLTLKTCIQNIQILKQQNQLEIRVWLHSCQNSKLVNISAPTSELLLQPNQSTFEIPLIQQAKLVTKQI